MSRSLRVLLVEDYEEDAELILIELQRAGFVPEWERVCTRETFQKALDSKDWQIVLADFHMPRFTAIGVIELLNAEGRDLPVIIVSGSVGEAVAVEAMKAGAHDFFSKGNLARLPSAIDREIKEAVVRRERRKALDQLGEAEERYRLVIEHVRDYAIFYLTPERRVATWSLGATRILGYDQDEVIGKPLRLFSPDEKSDELESELNQADAGQVVHEEGWIRRKDGSRFWAERSFEQILQGEVLLGYTAIIRDVSERKKLLDDLRYAINARDEFLSVASHELKTPIHSLKLQLELVDRRLAELEPPATQRLITSLATMRRQVDRLVVLSTSLMDLSSLSAGVLFIRSESVDVAEVVRACVERISSQLARTGNEVRTDLRPGVMAFLDPSRLDQILMNLLTNASKYGSAKPLDVSMWIEDGEVSISVVDRGIGIAPEDLNRIFEKFERAMPVENYGGLGLGLFICEQLTRAMGGTICATSTPGEGSTFSIRFPIEASATPRPFDIKALAITAFPNGTGDFLNSIDAPTRGSGER